MRLGIVVITLVILVTRAHSQVKWIATTNGDWSTGTNWSTGSPPGATDQVVFDGAGGANGNCTLTGAVTIGSMKIDGYSGTIQFGANNLAASSPTGVSYFKSGTITGTGTLTITHMSSAIPNTNGTVTFIGTTFYVPVVSTSENYYLNGSVFHSSASFDKNGSVSSTYVTNASDGGNTFNGPTTISCRQCVGNWAAPAAGDRYITFGNLYRDRFNGDLTLLNSGASVLLANASAGNEFNGNIIVTSALDVRLGVSGGTSTLADGKTITLNNSMAHFIVNNFEQLGTSAAQVLSMRTNATSTLNFSNSRFNAALTTTSRTLVISGGTFKGTSTFNFGYVTGGGSVSGSPTFDGDVTVNFDRSNAGAISWASGTFNGNFNYNQLNAIGLSTIGPCSFARDLTTNAANSVGITATFIGASVQYIKKAGGSAPTFATLTLNKSGGRVDLTDPLGYPVVATLLVFSASPAKGILKSSAANYVENTTIGGSPHADVHVVGPVRTNSRTTAYTFPVGNGTMYAPIEISAPAAGGGVYEADFISSSAVAYNANMASPLVAVSNCEYWTLNKVSGTLAATVKVTWKSPTSTACKIGNKADLVVAQFNPLAATPRWESRGGTASGTSTTTAGDITSSIAITDNFNNARFTLGSISMNSPLPITLAYFTGAQKKESVWLEWKTLTEINNDRFVIENSRDGEHFFAIGELPGAGQSTSERVYFFEDIHAPDGSIYYRIRQIDFDGTETWSPVIRIHVSSTGLTVSPNPASRGQCVTFRGLRDEEIVAIDGFGRFLPVDVGNANILDTSSLAPGIHLFRTSSGRVVKLFVK